MIDIDNLSHRFIFEGHSLAKPIEGTLANVKGLLIEIFVAIKTSLQCLQWSRRTFGLEILLGYLTWLEEAFGGLPPGEAQTSLYRHDQIGVSAYSSHGLAG